MSSQDKLAGKNAVVTGSSRGIGGAVARALAARGVAVVVNGRTSGPVETVVEEIRAAGGRAVGHTGSVADFDTAAALVETCETELGCIDILINCAGTAEPPGTSILNLSAQDWRQLIDSHLTATFNCCRHAAPRMVDRGRGSIINTSSHASLGVYGGTGYPAGKGGTNSLTLAMASELRSANVRVNAICPGARTRLSSGPDYERHIGDLHARGILDDGLREASLAPPPAEYVANLYGFLASDLAADITGRIFSGAGGYVGLFAGGEETLLAYRDHTSEPPWEIEELAERIRTSASL